MKSTLYHKVAVGWRVLTWTHLCNYSSGTSGLFFCNLFIKEISHCFIVSHIPDLFNLSSISICSLRWSLDPDSRPGSNQQWCWAVMEPETKEELVMLICLYLSCWHFVHYRFLNIYLLKISHPNIISPDQWAFWGPLKTSVLAASASLFPAACPCPGPWSQITRSPCELSRTWPLQRPGQWDYQGSNRDTRVHKAKKMYFKDFLSYLCKGLNWKMFTKKKKKKKRQKMLIRMWRNRNLINGSAKWCSHYGKQHGSFSKNWKWNYHMIQHSHFWVCI